MCLAVILLISGTSNLLAQQASRIFIRGQVVEQTSGHPLPGVNVFIEGTTFGASTNSEGHFLFEIPRRYESIELTASMIGFATFSKKLAFENLKDEDLTIVLAPSVYNLEEVEVVASNREWKKNLERFERLILSTTDNSHGCTILNPEVLDFEFIQATGILKASASQPLIVENRSLGYRVTLFDAVLTGTDYKLRWEGSTRFEVLEPENLRQERRWKENRLKAYLGSTRHFLSALLAGLHEEEGFRFTNVDVPGQIVELGERAVTPNVIPTPWPSISQPETMMGYMKFEGNMMHEPFSILYVSSLLKNANSPPS